MAKTRADGFIASDKVDLHFVSGKGGVGKSAVAAALALSLARAGKKCLLVELGNQSFYKDYFDLAQVTYAPRPLRSTLSPHPANLDVALWSGSECLSEYVRYLLKIESLYRLFFENPVTRALVNVAPALPELAILGKITSGPPRNVGPEFLYDSVVVDAYATGHFLALLRAPLGMSKTVSFGPMGEQSRAIHQVISDPKSAHYYVVSTPEELPVTEALELSAELESLVGLRPTQILNRVFEDSLLQVEADQGKSVFQQAMHTQRDHQLRSRERLAAFTVRTLPFVLKNNSWDVVETLAESLNQGGL